MRTTRPSDAFTDHTYLMRHQYADASNLRARLAFHARFSTNSEPWHRWLFERIGLRGGERVLEVGCGSGELWQKNHDWLPSATLTLTDLSPGMVRESRSMLPHSWHYGCLDSQHLPFPSVSFDVVVANHMLYHVPDKRRAIGELRRVLRAGGRLIAATNGRSHLRELDELMERFLGSRRGHDDAEKFGLETGVDQLLEYFGDVHLVRYPDKLVVTETEPLIGYILSIEDGANGKAISRLRRYVDEEIASKGHIAISKDAGVLIAFT